MVDQNNIMLIRFSVETYDRTTSWLIKQYHSYTIFHLMRSCASTTQVKIALGSMKQIMFVYNKLQKRFAAVYWVLFFTGGFIMERGTLSAASE